MLFRQKIVSQTGNSTYKNGHTHLDSDCNMLHGMAPSLWLRHEPLFKNLVKICNLTHIKMVRKFTVRNFQNYSNAVNCYWWLFQEHYHVRIITHDVVTGHPKENARKMSSGCQNTAELAVACVLKVRCQSNSNFSLRYQYIVQ